MPKNNGIPPMPKNQIPEAPDNKISKDGYNFNQGDNRAWYTGKTPDNQNQVINPNKVNPNQEDESPPIYETNKYGVPQHYYEEPKKNINIALIIIGGLILISIIIILIIIII